MESKCSEIKKELGGTWKLDRSDNFEEVLKAMSKLFSNLERFKLERIRINFRFVIIFKFNLMYLDIAC
jgi:23S rRNA U2552 (ribose-2'-O)-methylase RlmE/FtsJ